MIGGESMLVSTFQLHNLAGKPDNALDLKPCCLEILRANNLLPFSPPAQPARIMTAEASIPNSLTAFKELSKAIPPGSK